MRWILLLCLMLSPTLASAEWFVDVYGGYTFSSEPSYDKTRETITSPTTRTTATTSTDFDAAGGQIAGLRMGSFAQQDPWLGVAIEAVYAHASLDRTAATRHETDFQQMGGGFAIVAERDSTVQVGNTDLHLFGGFANLMLRYPHARLQPYGGGGLGALHAATSSIDGGGGIHDTQLAYQGFVGIKAFLLDQVGAFLEYRHIGTGSEFTSGRDGHTSLSYSANHLIGGITYHFAP